MSHLLFFLLLGQDQLTFHTDLSLVHVDVQVSQDRQPVENLGKESFRVTDGGRPQNIVYFSHQQQPLDVVLFFDVSAETRPAIERGAEVAHTALSDLGPADRLAVMASGRTQDHCRPRLISDFMGDFERAGRDIAIQVIPPELRAQIRACQVLSGIAGVAQYFLQKPNGNRRRAVLVITDDQGAGTAAALVRNTVRDLWNADAVVLGVLVHSGNSVLAIGPPHRGARYAADQTGGDTLTTGDAVDGVREMIHRLRLRYSIYYALPQGRPGEERKIGVKLTPAASKQYPRATIRARTAYVVPGNP